MINAIALSETRTERGLSQRKFARLVGLNYQVIRRLELGGDDGNLTLRAFERICTTLEANPADLITMKVGTIQPEFSVADEQEIDLSQARLLRRLQKGHDPRHALSAQDRQVVLPSLMKLGLAQVRTGGEPRLSSRASVDFAQPDFPIRSTPRL